MKTISSRISLLSLAALLGLPFAAQARFSSRIELTAVSQDLQNNVIYDVSTTSTISGAAGQAALRVPAGGIVAINVKPGVTLTVTGGDGNGASGAGPGILVPANSKLYLLGGGEIIARGGNAGNGSSGGDGGSGGTDRKSVV